jgi:hypothetical protein
LTSPKIQKLLDRLERDAEEIYQGCVYTSRTQVRLRQMQADVAHLRALLGGGLDAPVEPFDPWPCDCGEVSDHKLGCPRRDR